MLFAPAMSVWRCWLQIDGRPRFSAADVQPLRDDILFALFRLVEARASALIMWIPRSGSIRLMRALTWGEETSPCAEL